MKLGTESKNKTIIAAVLLGLALVFLARWFLETPGTTASAPRAGNVAAAPLTRNVPDQPPARTRRDNNRDQRTLRAAWKPSLDPRLNLAMLKSSEDVTYEGKGRNIFEATPEPAPNITIPVPIVPGRTDKGSVVPPAPAGPPPPPPINIKFFGYENKTGQRSIFLAQGDAVFVAREGDIIARRYRIVHINPSSVEIQDMLSNNKQTIALTAG